MTATDKVQVDQFYAYIAANDIASANALFETYPRLKGIIITSERMQYHNDEIISIERFYLNDIQQYLIDFIKPKGDWNKDTVYTKGDLVQYVNNEAIESYLGNVVIIPKGTLPTDIRYFHCVTTRGQQGVSGTGMSARGSWSNIIQYYTNDCVANDNILWYAKQNSLGQTPQIGEYWDKLMELPKQIVTSVSQPSGQGADEFWYEIL